MMLALCRAMQTMIGWRHPGRRTIAGATRVIALTIPLLVLGPGAPFAAGAPAMEAVRAEAIRGGYRLIDFEGLRERLEREPDGILLVDTRQDWEYRTGHIPGSINFSFEPTRWSRLKNRWALREALGADRSRPLVFY
jgi:hypothetical protein